MAPIECSSRRGSPRTPPATSRAPAVSVVIACLCVSTSAWCNIVVMRDSPGPGFLDDPHGGIARLVIPFLLTFVIETPVVVFLLRKHLTIPAAALASFGASICTYPLAFYLYWVGGWQLLPIELLVAAAEFLLLTAAVAIAGRLQAVVLSPSWSRVLATAVAANTASAGIGWILMR